MYVDEKMPYNMRNDLNELNNLKDTESLFIEIEKQKSKSKNIVIGVIYGLSREMGVEVGSRTPRPC